MIASIIIVMLKLLLCLVAMFVANGLGANLPPPIPSIESGQLNAYVQDHGKNLFEGFSRVRLNNIHPGGASAVKQEVVDKAARSIFHRVSSMDDDEKFKYLTGMHRRASEAHERGEW